MILCYALVDVRCNAESALVAAFKTSVTTSITGWRFTAEGQGGSNNTLQAWRHNVTPTNITLPLHTNTDNVATDHVQERRSQTGRASLAHVGPGFSIVANHAESTESIQQVKQSRIVQTRHIFTGIHVHRKQLADMRSA